MPLKNITATGMFCPNGHPLLRTYENQRSGLMTEYGRELLPTAYKSIDSKPFYWKNRLYLWTISEKSLEVYEVLADPPGNKPKK